MIRSFTSCLVFSLSAIFTMAHGGTIYVPDDHSTIQDAINVAVDGDTVIVRPGTYVENIDFVGKAITVKSEMGAKNTIIDGRYFSHPHFGCTVNFENSEGTDSVLDGFTICNGTGREYSWGSYGGGINCYYASPTISNNIITNNCADVSGGRIYCCYSDSIIRNNTINDNYSVNGGGICLTYNSVNVKSNKIISNYSSFGGGLACVSDFSIIEENLIQSNSSGSGGGIHCSDSSVPLITMNVISGNSATFVGGGIKCEIYSAPDIVNNIIDNNQAMGNNGRGGGIYCHNSDIFITNNTITMNSSLDRGGGIYCRHKISGVSAEITNTLLWENDSQSGPEVYLSNKAIFSISHSDLKGGQSSVYVEPGCTLNWGSGMIDADPLFLDPANDDFHIPFDSPCRTAGDRNATNLPETDFEGDPRTGLFAFPDIGADEFHTHFYVNGTVSNGNTATGVIIGWPGTNPVLLISGSGVLETPQSTPFGDFWLVPPWNHRVHFNAMPDNGVRIIDRVVSTGLPPATQIPFQALVGTELSNLCVVEIE